MSNNFVEIKVKRPSNQWLPEERNRIISAIALQMTFYADMGNSAHSPTLVRWANRLGWLAEKDDKFLESNREKVLEGLTLTD